MHTPEISISFQKLINYLKKTLVEQIHVVLLTTVQYSVPFPQMIQDNDHMFSNSLISQWGFTCPQTMLLRRQQVPLQETITMYLYTSKKHDQLRDDFLQRNKLAIKMKFRTFAQ